VLTQLCVVQRLRHIEHCHLLSHLNEDQDSHVIVPLRILQYILKLMINTAALDAEWDNQNES
jgi:hypothetical protein